jgi:rhodanese-related sulfurtransferase
MKNFWVQLILILVISSAIGLAYNQFSKTPLPVFQTYKADAKTDRDTGEDLTVYYQEMDAETLDSLRESDSIVILDAREPGFYETSHIPGAINLPIIKFNETYQSVAPILKEGKSIVLYCISEQCTDSSLLARELSKKGHMEIFVYKGGIEEWTAMGLPVQTPQGIVTNTELQEGTGDEHEGHEH